VKQPPGFKRLMSQCIIVLLLICIRVGTLSKAKLPTFHGKCPVASVPLRTCKFATLKPNEFRSRPRV